jgi:hypothetical protein
MIPAALAVLSTLVAAEPAPRFVLAPGSPHAVGPRAGRPVLADADADGNLDVLVACGTERGAPESGHVVVLLGDGKGGFRRAPATPHRIGPSVHKVAVADFDGDGRLDAAAAEHDSATLTVLLGDGTGGFRPAPSSPVPTGTAGRPHTHAIAAADVNGDGRPDLLATLADDGKIAVLLGAPGARFEPAPGSPFPAGRHPYDSLSTADVDGDGKLDLVAPDMHGHAITVLRGDGRGGFAHARGSPFPASGKRPGFAVVADVDRDGHPDVVATHDDDPLLTILLGDGKGGFAPSPKSPYRLPRTSWGLAAHEAGGGVLLACGTYQASAPFLLRGDGAGGLEPAGVALPAAGAQPGQVAWGDVNGDGLADLVTAQDGSGDVAVYLRRGGAAAPRSAE